MRRQEMPKSIDQRVFRNTAIKVKQVNIAPRVMRGCTRL